MTNQPKDRLNYLIGTQLRCTTGGSIPMPTGSQLGQMYAGSTPLTREQYDYVMNLLPGAASAEPSDDSAVYFYLFRAPKPFHIVNTGKATDAEAAAKQLAKVKPFLSINRLNLTKGTYETLFVRPGGASLEDFRLFYEANRRVGMFYSTLRAMMANGAEVKLLEQTKRPSKPQGQKKTPGPQPVQRPQKPAQTTQQRPAPKPATHTLGSHWPQLQSLTEQPQVVDNIALGTASVQRVDESSVIGLDEMVSLVKDHAERYDLSAQEPIYPVADTAGSVSETSVDVSDTSVDVSIDR